MYGVVVIGCYSMRLLFFQLRIGLSDPLEALPNEEQALTRKDQRIFVHQRAAGKEGVGVGERKNLKLRICLTPLMMLPSQAILVLMQSRPPAMLLTLTSMNPSRTLSRSMNPSLQRTEGGNREQMLNLPVDRPLQFQR